MIQQPKLKKPYFFPLYSRTRDAESMENYDPAAATGQGLFPSGNFPSSGLISGFQPSRVNTGESLDAKVTRNIPLSGTGPRVPDSAHPFPGHQIVSFHMAKRGLSMMNTTTPLCRRTVLNSKLEVNGPSCPSRFTVDIERPPPPRWQTRFSTSACLRVIYEKSHWLRGLDLPRVPKTVVWPVMQLALWAYDEPKVYKPQCRWPCPRSKLPA